MKIIFDIDGTLTNYNDFIRKKAVPYIKSNYQLEVANINALEIEDIFDIQNQFIMRKFSKHEAHKKKAAIINNFWQRNFVSFFTLRFRNGVKSFFKRIKNNKNGLKWIKTNKKQ